MYLDQAKKQEIFGKYGKSNTDTGSAESQIALFTYRIAHLTEHLKKNHKDHVTTRSLTMLVGKRRPRRRTLPRHSKGFGSAPIRKSTVLRLLQNLHGWYSLPWRFLFIPI